MPVFANFRALLFNIFFWLWTALLVVAGVPIALFGTAIMMRRLARFWMQGVQLALGAIIGLRYRVQGEEHLNRAPVIIASKHQSAWETMFFHLLRLKLVIALKYELTKIPLFGWYLMRARNIKLDRGGAARTMRSLIRGAKQAIKDGDSILIFPEGTRKAPGSEPDYKPGVAALYGALHVPVVPVALNSGCFWGRRSFLKRAGVIDVRFLPPIEPGLDRQHFMEQLQERIERATQELVAQAEHEQASTKSTVRG